MIVLGMFTGRKVGTAFILAAYFVVIGLFILIHYVNRRINQLNQGRLLSHCCNWYSIHTTRLCVAATQNHLKY